MQHNEKKQPYKATGGGGKSRADLAPKRYTAMSTVGSVERQHIVSTEMKWTPVVGGTGCCAFVGTIDGGPNIGLYRPAMQ